MPLIKAESLKVGTLRELLRERDLSTKGTKAELVTRLIEGAGTDEFDIEDESNELKLLRDVVSSLAATVESLSKKIDSKSEKHNSDIPKKIVSDDHFNHSHSIRDIVELLPDFEPTKTSSLTAKAFIQRVRQLATAYNWNEAAVVFAVQTKLNGPAKLWFDSCGLIFENLKDFAEALESEFPHVENEADIHFRMSSYIRKPTEPVIDFFYRVYAEGRKGQTSDAAIIQYIRRGLNHGPLQNAIAPLNFQTTNELLDAVNRFLANRQRLPEASQRKPENDGHFEPIKKLTATPVKNANRVCYNCFKPGHISVNCPQPQRLERCAKCSKTGHTTEFCKSVLPASRNINQVVSDGVPDQVSRETGRITKNILLDDMVVDAFIDPGSDRTLVRESVARNSIPCDPIILKGFAGGSFVCDKKINAVITIDECVVNAVIYVVNDNLIPNALLLGSDVLLSKNRRMIIDSDGCRFETIKPLNIKPETELSSNEKRQFNEMITEFRQCFAETIPEMGRCQTKQMDIQLIHDKPIQSRAYRIPLAKRQVVDRIVQELLDNEIIRHSNSTYSSPIVLVKKQNGEDRLCVDYRAINEATRKRPYPMPTVDEIMSQIADSTYFITLDLFSGYYQIELTESSKQYTAFITHNGQYEFNVMPFGLVNAPMEFQSVISGIIRQMKSKRVINYIDEVIIGCRDIAEGMDLLRELLTILKNEGLTLRPSKCTFFARKIEFLGHTVSENGIMPGTCKINAVVNFPTPTSITEVRSFLGLTGFFRKFVQNYALIAKPLTSLLRNQIREFKWTEECEIAFNLLKKHLSEEPVLALYKPTSFHEVHTDASMIGLAGILMQSEDQLTWRAVFYYSRQCSDAEQKYHSNELEVLAIVESLERFRFYLLGKRFRVITDCNAISSTKTTTPLNHRVARWWLKLQEYDFEVTHRSGSRMHHVDALSRKPAEPSAHPNTVADLIMVVEINENDWLASMQRQDPVLKGIIDVLSGKTQSTQESQLKTDYKLKNGRLMRRLGSDLKFVVPNPVRWRVVRSHHDDVGHPGCEKTLARLRDYFWFPMMRRYVKSYLASCVECCFNKIPTGKREGKMYFEEIEPIPFRCLHIDHLGPFPRSRKGNYHIIAISDPFSKYTILRAVRTTNAKSVIALLIDVSAYFGLPKRIISDRGSAFTAKEFEQYCDRNDILHIKVPVRTPRANGQVERVNQTILSHLRCSTENRHEWDTLLPMVQWSLNSQKHSTTGFTPNRIVFDFELRDVIANRMIQALNNENDTDTETTLTSIEIRQKAAERIMNEKTRWKLRFDAKHKSPTTYEEGDLVVVENVPTATGESHKLEPKYKGPYIISKVLRHDRYVIEDLADIRGRRRYSSVYTSDKLKPWCYLSPEIDCYEESDENDEPEIGSISMSGEAELSSPDTESTTLP